MLRGESKFTADVDLLRRLAASGFDWVALDGFNFGGDAFNDKAFSNNHQSGSDYRILGTSAIIRG